MADDRLARLPNLFRQIVENDREIEDACAQPVVPFKRLKEMFERRRELARHAVRAWRQQHLSPFE